MMCVSHSKLGTDQHVFKQHVFVASPFSGKIFLSRWWEWRFLMKTSDAAELLPVEGQEIVVLTEVEES